MGIADRDFEEKRNFIRMTMNASATMTLDDGKAIDVTCIDLSANGMTIKATQSVSQGSKVHIRIDSPNEQFRSMDAEGKVLRSSAIEDGEYDLGIEIITIR